MPEGRTALEVDSHFPFSVTNVRAQYCANRYKHKSPVSEPTPLVRDVMALVPAASNEGSHGRETKLKSLLSAASTALAEDAAVEACMLAPGSMYLGGQPRNRLMQYFCEIAKQLKAREVSLLGSGRDIQDKTRYSSDYPNQEFDAYKEILDAHKKYTEMRGGAWTWSVEEVDRLERMRRVVQPAAARVAGAAVAHEALDMVWRETALIC